MTRSHNSGHGPQEVKHDRHENKSGMGDPRGSVKKQGGGAHNWGTETDELEGNPIEAAENASVGPPREPRVQVKSLEEFEKEKMLAEAPKADDPLPNATIADALPEELKK